MSSNCSSNWKLVRLRLTKEWYQCSRKHLKNYLPLKPHQLTALKLICKAFSKEPLSSCGITTFPSFAYLKWIYLVVLVLLSLSIDSKTTPSSLYVNEGISHPSPKWQPHQLRCLSYGTTCQNFPDNKVWRWY